MATGKLRKLSYIEKEIVINPSIDKYELNGINTDKAKFLYRDIYSTFREMNVGDYRIEKDSNTNYLKIINKEILNKEKIQVILTYDFVPSTYEVEFNVDINTLNNKYNELCTTTGHLWRIIEQQGMIGDSLETDLILPSLQDGQLFIRRGDHYEGISLTDAEGEIKKLIDQYVNEYKAILEKLKEHHKSELQNKKDTLNSELMQSFNKKEEELTKHKDNLKQQLLSTKTQSMKEIESTKNGVISAIKEQETDSIKRVNSTISAFESRIDNKVNSKKNELNNFISDKEREFKDNIYANKEKEQGSFLKNIQDKSKNESGLFYLKLLKDANEIKKETTRNIKEIVEEDYQNARDKFDRENSMVFEENKNKLIKQTNKGISQIEEISSTIKNELIEIKENKVRELRTTAENIVSSSESKLRNMENKIDESIESKTKDFNRLMESEKEKAIENTKNLNAIERLKYKKSLAQANEENLSSYKDKFNKLSNEKINDHIERVKRETKSEITAHTEIKKRELNSVESDLKESLTQKKAELEGELSFKENQLEERLAIKKTNLSSKLSNETDKHTNELKATTEELKKQLKQNIDKQINESLDTTFSTRIINYYKKLKIIQVGTVGQARLKFSIDGNDTFVDIPTVKGVQGDKGDTGERGESGKSLSFVWNGSQLGIKRDGDASYQYRDLKGIKGDRGADGLKGDKGNDGKNGEDGKSLNFDWKGTQLAIYKDGDDSFEYKELRGKDGTKGDKGKDGNGIKKISLIEKPSLSSLRQNYRMNIQYTSLSSEYCDFSIEKPKDGVGIKDISIEDMVPNSKKHTYQLRFQLTSGDSIYKKFTVNDGEKGEKGDKGDSVSNIVDNKNGTFRIYYDSKFTDIQIPTQKVDTSKFLTIESANKRYLYKSDADSKYLPKNALSSYYTATDVDDNFVAKTGSQTIGGNLTVQGSIYAADNVTAYSDIRLKKNIKPIGNALDKVLSLTGYTFDMNGKRNTGVIAQELRKVLPEAVVEDDKGYLSVAYGNIVGLLINAIKEQQRQIDELRGEKHGTSN